MKRSNTKRSVEKLKEEYRRTTWLKGESKDERGRAVGISFTQEKIWGGSLTFAQSKQLLWNFYSYKPRESKIKKFTLEVLLSIRPMLMASKK